MRSKSCTPSLRVVPISLTIPIAARWHPCNNAGKMINFMPPGPLSQTIIVQGRTSCCREEILNMRPVIPRKKTKTGARECG